MSTTRAWVERRTGGPLLGLRSCSCSILTISVLLAAAAPHSSLRACDLFLRGDCNGDRSVDVADAVRGLTYLFVAGTRSPPCLDACDADDDGSLSLSDAVVTLLYLFRGGEPLPAPRLEAGVDPTPDELDCREGTGCPGAGFRTLVPPLIRGDTAATSGEWRVEALVTVGERAPNGGSYNAERLGYELPGILDGIGAFQRDDTTVRVFVNHELVHYQGSRYSLANGLELRGARVSYVDIDRTTRRVSKAGLAYRAIFDAAGREVIEAAQVNETGRSLDGFRRFCSGQPVLPGEGGFVDAIYFAGEEIHGGRVCALDVSREEFYIVPMVGRAAFENVAVVGMPPSDKVLLLLGDDRAHVPLLLYTGEKDVAPQGVYEPPAFLLRNGLGSGKLWAWVADGELSDFTELKGTGNVATGRFLPIEQYRDLGNEAAEGYDALGFATQEKQDELATGEGGIGAFAFSRPEDLARDPNDGTRLAFTSTGSGADIWGTTYIIDFDDEALAHLATSALDSIAEIPATLEILYDGNDAGGGRFAHPDFGLRSPDNIDWAEDGSIYIQENRATSRFCAESGIEASVWKLDPRTGDLTRILELDRSVVPEGQIETDVRCGAWEPSGVLVVTPLFPTRESESLLLLDVQAHSLFGGLIDAEKLAEGGQLLFAAGITSPQEPRHD